jgi:hypothetical protein
MRALIIAAILALAGCTSMNPVHWISPYKMEIQQGNYVTEDAVAKLKPGMTRSQVRFAGHASAQRPFPQQPLGLSLPGYQARQAGGQDAADRVL